MVVVTSHSVRGPACLPLMQPRPRLCEAGACVEAGAVLWWIASCWVLQWVQRRARWRGGIAACCGCGEGSWLYRMDEAGMRLQCGVPAAV